MSEQSGDPGWWLASDAKWYPPQPPLPPVTAGSPAPTARGDRYEAVVNKKSINMAVLTQQLNQRWKNGWRLAHIYEQAGNTCMIFERRD